MIVKRTPPKIPPVIVARLNFLTAISLAIAVL